MLLVITTGSQAKMVEKEVEKEVEIDYCTLKDVCCEYEECEPIKRVLREIEAVVTAYNTVEAQTDSSPCVAAGNIWVCGRTDVVACPRNISLGTVVRIAGNDYICSDRTASKFDGRFDISFDKDIAAAREWGLKYLTVYIY